MENFPKWGPAFRMEFDITVQKSAEICTVKATSDVAMFGNWMKKSYEEAKAICGLSGKDLAYFEDDEASFDTFFEAFYNKNNYYFWVGAKIATMDGSRKYQVGIYFLMQLEFTIQFFFPMLKLSLDFIILMRS